MSRELEVPEGVASKEGVLPLLYCPRQLRGGWPRCPVVKEAPCAWVDVSLKAVLCHKRGSLLEGHLGAGGFAV